MSAATYALTLPGAMLERGFWLYVWRIETPQGEYLYVGRTGDSASPYATSPYRRMGQHLGQQKAQNALRRNLESKGIPPEGCRAFQFIAHGPLFPEAQDIETHQAPRDTVAALEKALADALRAADYQVINTVNCRKPIDAALLAGVLAAFAVHFPGLERGASPAESAS
jgi:hypothetical protein